MHFVDGRSHTINCEQRNYIKKIESGLMQLFYDTVMNSNTTLSGHLYSHWIFFNFVQSKCNPIECCTKMTNSMETTIWIELLVLTISILLNRFYCLYWTATPHIWLSIRIQKFVILLCPFISVCFSLLFFSSCDDFMCEYIYAYM